MNFLTSLNNNLGGSSDLASLFENLLEATQQNATTAQQGNKTNTASTPEITVSASVITSSPKAACDAISDIMQGLRTFAAKWNSYQNNSHGGQGQTSCKTQTPPAATSSAPAAKTSATTTTTNNAQSSSTNASASTPAASTDTASTTSVVTTPATTADNASTTAAGDDNTADTDMPPVLADLLAELQAIFQMLQQQIKTTQQPGATEGQITVATATSSSAATATIDTSTPATQELLAAGGALADLLALLQLLEKKLGAASPEDATQTTDTATATTTATPAIVDTKLAALDSQLRVSLKELLDNLKTAVVSGKTTNTATAAVTDTTPTAATEKTGLTNFANALVSNLIADTSTPTTDTVSLTTPTATVAPTTPTAATTPSDIIKSALATADDFMKQLNNLYGTPAPVAGAPTAAQTTDAVTAATGKTGAMLESALDGNNTTPTSTGTTPNATTLPLALEGTKSTNPYSFASQLSAQRAQNGGTTGLPAPVEQVLLFLNRNAKSGNDQMTLQLHPAELGTINIKLDIASNGNVSGTVTANNADTLAMLQKDSRSLERALQEAGLRADPGSLQFNLGGQSNNQSGQMTQQNQSSSGTAANDPSLADPTAITADTNTGPTDSWVITPGRVNIKV
jgi:hypothetical protein